MLRILRVGCRRLHRCLRHQWRPHWCPMDWKCTISCLGVSQTARQLLGPSGSCMGLDSTGSAALGNTIVHTCDTFATPYLGPNFSSQANLGVVLETGSFLSVATLMELNSEPICPMHSILANILIVSQSTISLDIVLCDTWMFDLRH